MAQPSHPGIYDEIGAGYRARRRPDPRIAAQIHAALDGARRVCNVGAGAGSYEPTDRRVIAVEPSRTMLAQRTGQSAALVRGVGEALPFRDRAFDAVTAILTVHHWLDVDTGLAELRRVAPRRVLLHFDLPTNAAFWLIRDYLPGVTRFDADRAPSVEHVCEALGDARVEPVPVPWDCSDGFLAAYWRRPEAYLDPAVRASISTLSQMSQDEVESGIARLAEDLRSGAWARRNGDLLERETIDPGYRLIVSDAESLATL